jgi:hypothetical protein
MAAADSDRRALAGSQGNQRGQGRVQGIMGPKLHPGGSNTLLLQARDPLLDSLWGAETGS